MGIIEGRLRIALRRERLWTLLNDCETLVRIVPGCISATRNDTPGTSGIVLAIRSDVGGAASVIDGVLLTETIDQPLVLTLGHGQHPRIAVVDLLLTCGRDNGTDLAYNMKIVNQPSPLPIDIEIWRRHANATIDQFLRALDSRLEGSTGGIRPAFWVPGFVAATLLIVAASALL